MRISPMALALVLPLSACHPAPTKTEEPARESTVATEPAADTAPVTSGALAGPIGDLGIHSVVVPPDTVSDSARRIANFSFSLEDGESFGIPVRVLLTDPSGRMIGRRPEWDSAKNEIPGGYYFTPAEPDSTEAEKLEVSPRIMINGPETGRYRLELFGLRARQYYLDFRFEPAEGRAFGPGGSNCTSVPGRVDTIWIDLHADSSRISGKCYRPE
jgi:hypothetical protein